VFVNFSSYSSTALWTSGRDMIHWSMASWLSMSPLGFYNTERHPAYTKFYRPLNYSTGF
jgi:hypothetical protein